MKATARIILLGLATCGLAAQGAPATRELPGSIRGALLCTKFGVHGDIRVQDLRVKLAGTRGRYDAVDPLSTHAFGRLSAIRYAFDESTIYGTWSAGGESGWFRWAFYDETGFYGSWGRGDVVAEHERGYWNGEVCDRP